MEKLRRCLYCGAPLYGRTDKTFCSDHCKDRWHNSRKSSLRRSRAEVMDILENNYEILQSLLSSGSTVWLTPLIETMGFRVDYFTRLVSQRMGSMVCECFDIRYRVSKTKLSSVIRLTDYISKKELKPLNQISSASRS